MTNPSPMQPTQPQLSDGLENKSLDTGDVETKDADEPARVVVTVPVKMLHHHDHDGKALLPGVQYELPRDLAATLVTCKRAVRL